MQDKRRHKRYALDFIDINSNMVFAKNVKLIDISIGGISLKADRRLNMAGNYKLRIEYEDNVLKIRGVVVWSRLSESMRDNRGNIVPLYSAGMQFKEVTDQKIDDIVQFIKNYNPEKLEDVDIIIPKSLRIHLMVPFDLSKEAYLQCEDNCTVKELSADCMLMESGSAMEIDETLPIEIIINEEILIKFIGKVASCMLIQNKKPASYEIGMDFLDLMGKDRDVLYEFIYLLNHVENISTNPFI
jgi:hypothetical protein